MSRPKIAAAVVDSSALMSILMKEAADTYFQEELTVTAALYMSAPTAAEVSLAAMASKGPVGVSVMNQLITLFNIRIVGFAEDDLNAYQVAAEKYHVKGRARGLLNMGDIYSLILAEKMAIPLFFQGLDFLHTPICNAMALLGYDMTLQNKGIPSLSGSAT